MKKQAAAAELASLLKNLAEIQCKDTDMQEHQDVDLPELFLKKDELQSEIANLDNELVSLYAKETQKFLAFDDSIGSKHSAEAEKMKKAASSFTRIKVEKYRAGRAITRAIRLSMF
jgi:ABC-type phosphate transport system auxiliary subunit